MRSFAAGFRARRPDLRGLLHNAGVLVGERAALAQGHELTLATHVLGPLLLSGLLAPDLRAAAPSRVVFVSSGGMYTARLRADDLELEREEFDGTRFYAHAKRLQVIAASELAERWGPEGIRVYSMHPGWVRTGGLSDALPRFTRLVGPLLRDPQQGADTAVWLLASPDVPRGPSGFWHDRRPADAPAAADARERRASASARSAELVRLQRVRRLRRGGARAGRRPDEQGRNRGRRGGGAGRRARARPRRARDHRLRGRLARRWARAHGRRSTSRARTSTSTSASSSSTTATTRTSSACWTSSGCATKPAEMSLSVSDGEGEFEWCSRPGGVFARPLHLADPRFHRMIADLARFFREARGLVGANGSGPSLGEFLDEGGYSRWFVDRLLVPQVSAVWSADPASSTTSRRRFSPSSSPTTGRFSSGPAAVAHGLRRLADYVERLVEPSRDRLRLGTPVRRCAATRPGSSGRPTRHRALRRGRPRRALRSGAGDAGRPVAARSARSWARSPTSATTPSCTPTRPAATPPPRLGVVELPPRPRGRRADDDQLPHEPPPVARRRARAAADAQPRRADRPGDGDRRVPFDHPVYTRAGLAAQRRWAEISGARRTHYCGAYWRWGFHEDGVWSALRACARAAAPPRRPSRRPGAGGMTASAIYEGWVAPPPPGAGRARVPLPVALTLLDLDELPEVLDRHPLWSARRPALVRWRREDFLGDPGMPLADAARAWCASGPGRRRAARCACSPGLRFAGHAFNPISLLYLHGHDGGGGGGRSPR